MPKIINTKPQLCLDYLVTFVIETIDSIQNILELPAYNLSTSFHNCSAFEVIQYIGMCLWAHTMEHK
eukprot:c20422_g2_i1 orf=159-359(+)